KSRKTRSIGWDSKAVRASCPSPADTTSCPENVSRSDSPRTISGSSSATRIRIPICAHLEAGRTHKVKATLFQRNSTSSLGAGMGVLQRRRNKEGRAASDDGSAAWWREGDRSVLEGSGPDLGGHMNWRLAVYVANGRLLTKVRRDAWRLNFRFAFIFRLNSALNIQHFA